MAAHHRARRHAATARCATSPPAATTYLCNDLAYHRDKLRRGFDHLIDIWGSDHQGQVKSLQAGMQALTGLAGEPEVLLGQYVKLFDVDPNTGKRAEMKMSKRAGTFVSLGDVLDRVDGDVARMTFLLQSIDTTLTFDLAVVTAQSMENPVYYIQMAHARIASIARKAAEARHRDAAARRGRPRRAHRRPRARAAAHARGLSRTRSPTRPEPVRRTRSRTGRTISPARSTRSTARAG